MSRITIAGRSFVLPGHPLLRKGLGVLLVIGGIFGFLPVLGFWMIPLGLAILSIDVPPVRRFYRRTTVRLGYLLHTRWPRLARHFGYGNPRPGKH
jgi:hypothetical protein